MITTKLVYFWILNITLSNLWLTKSIFWKWTNGIYLSVFWLTGWCTVLLLWKLKINPQSRSQTQLLNDILPDLCLCDSVIMFVPDLPIFKYPISILWRRRSKYLWSELDHNRYQPASFPLSLSPLSIFLISPRDPS